MTEIVQMVRVELINDWWCVMVPSPVPGIGWICQSEHRTKRAAEEDAKAFR